MPRVAVLVETSTSWGRGVIAGIGNYTRRHGPWALHIEVRGWSEPAALPAGWVGEGVIARIHTPALAKMIARRKLPTVNVSQVVLPGVEHPRVITDQREIIEQALGHLRERAFVNFAYYVGAEASAYAQPRAQTFKSVLTEAGFKPHVFVERRGRSPGNWKQEKRNLNDWLVALPKPVGVMAFNSIQARLVAEACRWAGLHVPEDVAIIAADTDELLTELVHPPLSGVQLAPQRMGYEAAALLDAMMRGQPVPQCVTVPTIGVVTRHSTDVLAVDEPLVREALRFIRQHAGNPIDVSDILAAVPIARRVLERQFQELLGRSPGQEIRRVRVELAKQMLAQTDLPVSKVAQASGFVYPERLITVFRKATGLTPLAFRRKTQPR